MNNLLLFQFLYLTLQIIITESRRTLRYTLDNFLFFSINCIIKLLGFKKRDYEER